MFVATVPYMDSHVRAFSGKACVRLMLHDRCAMPLCKPNTSFAFFLILLGVVGGRRSENPCDRTLLRGFFVCKRKCLTLCLLWYPMLECALNECCNVCKIRHFASVTAVFIRCFDAFAVQYAVFCLAISRLLLRNQPTFARMDTPVYSC